MAAGDLVVADYQVELRGTLSGEGTSLELGPEGITGLGNPATKDADAPLGHADGSFLGRDYLEPRVVTIDYSLVQPGSPAAAGALLASLRTMWAKSEATTLPLWIQLPGLGKFVVMGRPRGLVEDTTQIKFGFVRALATFYCGDPTILSEPGAPTITSVTSGNGQGTVNWSAPASNGGSPITGYRVTTYNELGAVHATDTVGVVLTFTKSGLTNGSGYRFTVAAITAIATGPASARSSLVLPLAAGVPSVPTNHAAIGASGVHYVRFDAPSSSGSSALTGYRHLIYTAADPDTLVGWGGGGDSDAYDRLRISSTTPWNVPLVFRVQAKNAQGWGPRTTLTGVSTPTTGGGPAPSAPASFGTITTPSAGRIVLTWTAPASAGGSSIRGFIATMHNASTNAQIGVFAVFSNNATTMTIDGLPSGSSVYFRVTAFNQFSQGAHVQSPNITIA